MHLETFLYMLLQSNKTLPPPGAAPDFKAMADDAVVQAVHNEWFRIPESEVIIGLEDPEQDSGPTHYFGWDNEKPVRSVRVPAFEAKARPITNREYVQYLQEIGETKVPASWTSPKSNTEGFDKRQKNVGGNGIPMNGNFRSLADAYLNGKAVKTVYGPVPLKLALDWPLIASYDELLGCVKWMKGRIPTMEEARSIYNFVDQAKSKLAGDVLANTIPAVNG